MLADDMAAGGAKDVADKEDIHWVRVADLTAFPQSATLRRLEYAAAVVAF
jgi:hypothetical protein